MLLFFRSLYYDTDKELLYAAAGNEFGVWKRNEYGNYEYTRFYHNRQNESPEIFWKILPYGKKLYFQTHASLYRYDPGTGQVSLVMEAPEIHYIHLVNNALYVQKEDSLLKEEQGEYKPTGVSAPSRIITFFTRGNSTVYITEDQGLWREQDGKVFPVKTPASQRLTQARIFSAYCLNDSVYLLGSVVEGVFFMDKNLEIIKHIGYAAGLDHTTVLSIGTDREQNIWLGLDGGVGRVQSHPAEIRVRNKNKDIGSIYDAVWYENALYVATNKGMYRYLGNHHFELITGSQGQVWKLHTIDNTLFVCHDKGIYRLKGTTLEPENTRGAWQLKPLNKRNGYYLGIDFEGGFSLYQIRDGKFSQEKKIEGFTGSNTDAGIDRFGHIWIQDRQNSPIRIKLNDSYHIEIIEKYELPPGVTTLYRADIDNDVIFFEERVAFTYDITTNSFKKNDYYTQLLAQMLFSPDQIIQTGDNFFYSNRHQSGYMKRYRDSFLNYGEVLQALDTYTIPTLARRFITLDEQTIAAGLQNSILLYSIENSEWDYKNRKDIALIRIQYKKESDPQYLPVRPEQAVVIPFGHRLIQLGFSGPYSHRQVLYNIDGEEWKLAKAAPLLDIPSLSPGKHTIQIRNMEINRQEGEPVTLILEVTKPFYYAPLFYFLLLAAILFIVLAIRKVFKRHIRIRERMLLEKQRRVLERKKKEYHMKFLRMKVEENEKRLVTLTMENVKRNGMLNEIRKEVTELAGMEDSIRLKQQANAIIRKIEGHLNDSQAQELFDEYFNTIYDGFFDRLMARYPHITRNDMRLCAYIRLNLNTKEIAAYMNITPASVEIARHRLRKKLELEKEESLQHHLSTL
ncbi:MAG: hypothetical protein LUE93_04670 [Bacteroides sp.]|nr:hypothetical protein [Bacteroides sp.]